MIESLYIIVQSVGLLFSQTGDPKYMLLSVDRSFLLLPAANKLVDDSWRFNFFLSSEERGYNLGNKVSKISSLSPDFIAGLASVSHFTKKFPSFSGY